MNGASEGASAGTRWRRGPSEKVRNAIYLAQGERDFDEDQDGHRLAEAHAGFEAPLLKRFDRFLVEAKLLIEGVNDADLADGAVGHHDRFEFDETLNARAHGLARVVRFGFVNQHRRGDAIALAIDAA